MKDTLNSLILNRLLKIRFSEDEMWKIKNDNAACHNTLKFTRRNGEPIDFMWEIGPVMERMEEDEAFCVGNEGRFQPEEIGWEDFDKDFNFGIPLVLDKKEEMRLIEELKKNMIENCPDTVTSITSKDSVTAEDIMNHDMQAVLALEKFRKYGYQGKYKEVAALMSDIAYDGQPVSLREAGLLWSHIELDAYIKRWLAMKKIYRISNVLEEDFINQKEVLVPTNALQYLPFRSFAIDVSENEILGKYFDSVFVTVNEYQGNYVIDCKVYDKAGLVANNGFQIAFSFVKDKDTGLTDEFLDNKYQKGCLNLYDSIKKEHAEKAREVEELKACRNPLSRNYIKLTDKEFAKEVEKITGFGDARGRAADTSSFLDYHRIPEKRFKQMERFLFCTIFYLCCSNKKTSKRKAKVEETSEKGKWYQSPVAVAEMEDLGFEMEKMPEIAFNELRLDKEDLSEDQPTGGNRGSKKGSKKRPHLVRGHFHHYRCGKGRQETVYKYTAPYYTGTKNNVISVTTLK